MRQYQKMFLMGTVLLIVVGALGSIIMVGNGSIVRFTMGPLIDFVLSPAMIATEALSLALIAFGAWKLTLGRLRTDKVTNVAALLIAEKKSILLVFGLFCVVSIAIATQYWRDLYRTADLLARQQLEAVARLKSEQLEKWMHERSASEKLFAASLGAFPLERWSSDREMRSIVEVLVAEMLAGNAERVAVALYGIDGVALTKVGIEIPQIDMIRASSRARSGNGEIVVEQLPPPGRPEGAPLLLFLVPIKSLLQPKDFAAIAVVVMDPELALIPSLHTWPVPSATGEVTIGRLDGDSVLAIQPPSSRGGRTAPWRVPLTERLVPVVLAVTEGKGVRTGVDPLGYKVLFASAQPRDIDWTIVAKMDVSEVFAEVSAKSYVLIFVVAAAIGIAGLILSIIWQSQRSSVEHFAVEKERELLALSKHYHNLFKSMRDCAFLFDMDGQIVDANDAAIHSYGYSANEFKALNVKDLRSISSQEKIASDWHKAIGSGGAVFGAVHRRKDGTTFPVEICANPFIATDGTRFQQGYVRDISIRKSLEDELARLTRVKRALFAAAEAVLRASSRKEVFDGVCLALTGEAGFKAACIHEPVDDLEKTTRIAALSGAAAFYIYHAKISWGDNEWGQGPTGLALRLGKIQVNQDFGSNPTVKVWRDLALSYGLHSSISVPLIIKGTIVGALTIYSEVPQAFDTEEVDLMRHLSDVVTLGMRATDDKAKYEAHA